MSVLTQLQRLLLGRPIASSKAGEERLSRSSGLGIARRWWQEALHNQTALQLQMALRGIPGVVITTVPVCL